MSCVYAAIRTVLDAAIPNNAGLCLYRPITVRTTPDTFVDVRYPAAVGSRGQVGFRLRSIVLGALALLADDVQVQVRSDRFKSRSWGLFGGGSGEGARSILNPGRPDQQYLPSKFTRRFRAGDVLRFEMAGAGGYGDPALRDPARIAEDVRQGKTTPTPS